jgi:hypothetical protein
MSEQKRNKMMGCMMTKDEYIQLQKDAYAHEMNASAYIRWLVEKERKKMTQKKRGN